MNRLAQNSGSEKILWGTCTDLSVFLVCGFLTHLGGKSLDGRATQTVIGFLFEACGSSGSTPPAP